LSQSRSDGKKKGKKYKLFVVEGRAGADKRTRKRNTTALSTIIGLKKKRGKGGKGSFPYYIVGAEGERNGHTGREGGGKKKGKGRRSDIPRKFLWILRQQAQRKKRDLSI